MASSPTRSGVVTCQRAGDRWSVELRLDEPVGDESRLHTVVLGQRFATEAGAIQAGEQALAEWKRGQVATRDLMLKELAATYRRLREAHKTMQPSTVPTTRTAWERALDAWENLGWIASEDTFRYRTHVDHAFTSEPHRVQRRHLPLDADSEAS
jgi:hypothetical protein